VIHFPFHLIVYSHINLTFCEALSNNAEEFGVKLQKSTEHFTELCWLKARGFNRGMKSSVVRNPQKKGVARTTNFLYIRTHDR